MGSCGSKGSSQNSKYSVMVGDEYPNQTRAIRSPNYAEHLLEAPQKGHKTVFETLMHAFDTFGTKPLFGTPEDGTYNWKSYKDIKELSTKFGSGLTNLGLCPDVSDEMGTHKFLGIYSKNREEWMIGDIACCFYNIVVVPFYDTLGATAMQYMLEQTQLCTLLMSSDNLGKIVQHKREGLTGNLENLILMDPVSDQQKQEAEQVGFRVYEFQEVISQEKLEYSPPKPDNIYTLCYTSGTTGNPKGVILTHSSIVSQLAGVLEIFVPTPKDVHISYLPLAHIYERVVMQACVYSGASIGFYGGDVLKLKEDFAALKPTILASVPRLLNRFYDLVQSNFSNLTGMKAKLVAKGLAAKRNRLHEEGNCTHGFYDKLVFKKVKQVLGGRVRLVVTASAPISGDVLDFLKVAFCCPILEAYGQTETSGASTATLPTESRSGHVGGPVGCVEIKLQSVPEMGYLTDSWPPKGEICFRGPSICKGYYKLPKETAETIDQDGWLHSGDIGVLEEQGTIKIIDRVKNLFKLAQGEYVAPEKIENTYMKSKYVQLIFVHGDSLESYLVAMIVPDSEAVKEWAKKNNIEESWEQLCNNERVKEEVLRDMKVIGSEAGLAGFEQVRKIHLHPEMITPDSGILTPTFKIKRHDAKNFFQETIQSLYSSN